MKYHKIEDKQGNQEEYSLFGSPPKRKKTVGKKSIKLLGNLPPLDLDLVTEIANSPSKDIGYTRTYYSYPAKFQAQLPRVFISEATKPGDLVCDPYCGGGTTGLESMLLDRRFVGYDLNPFGILISKVKTTKIISEKIEKVLPDIIRSLNKHLELLFDDEDVECIGPELAREINGIYRNIKSCELPYAYTDFLKLALIHTIKIVGRRDFKENEDTTSLLFDDMPARSAIPLFRNKLRRMLEDNKTLPPRKYKPRFYCASNHRMRVEDASVDLIVTSPPYKDLDVEYGLIQLQRRKIGRSKRSELIWKVLGVKPVAKTSLCGERGDAYWDNLSQSVKECNRILKRQHLAFFWIGFKNQEDQDTFCSFLEENRLRVEDMIPARLGDDRVASSRSTHHGRETGMMKRDYLIVTRCL